MTHTTKHINKHNIISLSNKHIFENYISRMRAHAAGRQQGEEHPGGHGAHRPEDPSETGGL